MEHLTLLSLFIYMVIVFIIAFRNRIFDDGRGFVIGNRKVGTFTTASSIAAGLRDGTGVVTWITFAAAVGYGASWLILALAAMMFVMSIMAPKVRRIGAEINAVTIQDIIRHNVGKKLSITTSIIVFMTGLLLAAANLNVIGSLFSTIINTPKEITILITAVFVGIYLFIGGYKSVIKTDVFQLLILACISIIPFIKMDVPNVEESLKMFTSLDQTTFFAFVGIGLFYALGTSEYWQRMLSAKSEKSAQSGMRLGGIFLIFITFGLLGIGMWLAQMLPNTPSDDVYNAIFAEGTGVPIWVGTMVALIIASAVMSTIDTQVSLFSTTVVNVIFGINTTKDHMRFVRLCRAVIVVTMVVVSIAAIFIGDVVQFLFDVITIGMIAGPAYVYSVLAKRRKSKGRDFIISSFTAIGALMHIYMFSAGMFENLLFNIIPVATTAFLIAIYALWEWQFKTGYSVEEQSKQQAPAE